MSLAAALSADVRAAVMRSLTRSRTVLESDAERARRDVGLDKSLMDAVSSADLAVLSEERTARSDVASVSAPVRALVTADLETASMTVEVSEADRVF